MSNNISNRAKVESLLEDAIAVIKPIVSEQLIQIDRIMLAIPIVAERFGLKDYSVLFHELFQFEKIKESGNFSKGFPGIVITATVGRLIDSGYDPANNFYGINPRPLFEQHIRPILREKYNAPMGMSDPLNVAKNANVINDNWARGKRPESASKAVVKFVSYISKANSEELMAILYVLIFIYLALANLYIEEMPNVDTEISLKEIYELMQGLITRAPAGGETAQTIVGAMLNAQHELFGTEDCLFGIGENVNVTNTTSKKPGDFQEKFGTTLHVYEVTTKKVDIQRLVESSNAIFDFIKQSELLVEKVDVTFLCRTEDLIIADIKTTGNILLGSKVIKGLQYNFFDIWSWLLLMLERLGVDGRQNVISQIKLFVELPTTHLDVKSAWKVLISNN